MRPPCYLCAPSLVNGDTAAGYSGWAALRKEQYDMSHESQTNGTRRFGRCLPLQRIYTGCPGRNVPYFENVFLMLKYADITLSPVLFLLTLTFFIASTSRPSCSVIWSAQLGVRGLKGLPWTVIYQYVVGYLSRDWSSIPGRNKFFSQPSYRKEPWGHPVSILMT
jgi:hypothetical protein